MMKNGNFKNESYELQTFVWISLKLIKKGMNIDLNFNQIPFAY